MTNKGENQSNGIFSLYVRLQNTFDRTWFYAQLEIIIQRGVKEDEDPILNLKTDIMKYFTVEKSLLREHSGQTCH
jgi:hypothetical protein